jgi:hypothetical protein
VQTKGTHSWVRIKVQIGIVFGLLVRHDILQHPCCWADLLGLQPHSVFRNCRPGAQQQTQTCLADESRAYRKQAYQWAERNSRFSHRFVS